MAEDAVERFPSAVKPVSSTKAMRWSRQTHEAKVFIHPDVGRLTLEFSAFDVRGATGQQLIVYRAEPGSPSDDALRLLATLAATRVASRDHGGIGKSWIADLQRGTNEV